MDWIRQNTFLATFGGIVLAGILGLGFFAFSSWKGYGAATEEFNSTRDKLDRLENSPLHPDSENVQMVKTEVDAYEKAVDSLYEKLKADQKPLPTDVDPTKLGEKIQAKLVPFQEKAKEKEIVIGGNFYMGFDQYRTGQPDNDEALLQHLEWALGGISTLANLALDAEIETLDDFKRFESLLENPPAKPKPEPTSKRNRRSKSQSKAAPKAQAMADVSEEVRVRMKITGSPDSITKFFNLVTNNKEYFYWIRWAKVGNEVARGPSTTVNFAATPAGANPEADAPGGGGGGDGPTGLDAPEVEELEEGAEKPPTAMIDVFPILGTERVRADLLIDIVRFRDPPVPEDDKSKKRAPNR